jgi:hypothetical protein
MTVNDLKYIGKIFEENNLDKKKIIKQIQKDNKEYLLSGITSSNYLNLIANIEDELLLKNKEILTYINKNPILMLRLGVKFDVVKTTPTGIRYSLDENSNGIDRYKEGQTLVTFNGVSVDKDGIPQLKRETYNDGKALIKEDSIILSNGPVRYPDKTDKNGNIIEVGEFVRGNYKKNEQNEWVFEIDQKNGTEILQDEYVSDIEYVNINYNKDLSLKTKDEKIHIGYKIDSTKTIAVLITDEKPVKISLENSNKIQIFNKGDIYLIAIDKNNNLSKRGIDYQAFNNTYSIANYYNPTIQINDENIIDMFNSKIKENPYYSNISSKNTLSYSNNLKLINFIIKKMKTDGVLKDDIIENLPHSLNLSNIPKDNLDNMIDNIFKKGIEQKIN